MLRKGFQREEGPDGPLLSAPVENIWDRVRRWAKRHGKEYDPSFGVVGVAAT
jgi:hypothetical protein